MIVKTRQHVIRHIDVAILANGFWLRDQCIKHCARLLAHGLADNHGAAFDRVRQGAPVKLHLWGRGRVARR
jgi:hypothetical protein